MNRVGRLLLALGLTAGGMLILPADSEAQPKPRLEISLSPTVITFPAADPDTTPLVSAPPLTVTYRVRQLSGPWQITVLAAGDLLSGPSVVDISNVSWIATPGPVFRNGTLNKTVAQIVASGTGNLNPDAQGIVTFRLNNSWTYATGTYTQSVLFTISAP